MKIIKLIKNNLLAFIEIIRSVITQVLLLIGTIFESLVTIIGIIFKYVAGLALIIILIIWILSDKEIQKYSGTLMESEVAPPSSTPVSGSGMIWSVCPAAQQKNQRKNPSWVPYFHRY